MENIGLESRQDIQSALDMIQQDFFALLDGVPLGILILRHDLSICRFNQVAATTLGLKMMEHSAQQLFLQDMIGEAQLTKAEIQHGFENRVLAFGKERRRFSTSIRPSASGHFLAILSPLSPAAPRHRGLSSQEVAYFHFENIIGKSPALEHAIWMAKVAAQTDATVLLTGASGTGKELFAQSIHNASSRSHGPFVPVNCGALPKSLIESELFGYDSGSFTGAKKEGKAGKFEQANGGTIFLDEIAEMPLDVQATLLRVLQNREVSRIGSGKLVKIDVRVIAATNNPLSKLVQQNRFRGDLFYRLNVFCIGLPTLQEREGDLPTLINYFLKKYSDRRPDISIKGFSPDAFRKLEAYYWPGNIRELQNVVERAVYLAKSEYIEPEALPAAILQYQPSALSEPQAHIAPAEVALSGSLSLEEMEKQQIENALRSCHWNVEKAATLLKINRRTLYRRIEKYNLRRDELSN